MNGTSSFSWPTAAYSVNTFRTVGQGTRCVPESYQDHQHSSCCDACRGEGTARKVGSVQYTNKLLCFNSMRQSHAASLRVAEFDPINMSTVMGGRCSYFGTGNIAPATAHKMSSLQILNRPFYVYGLGKDGLCSGSIAGWWQRELATI